MKDSANNRRRAPSFLMLVAPWLFGGLALIRFGFALFDFQQGQIGLVKLILTPLGQAAIAWYAWSENRKMKR
jgi:hypothetical protein